MAALDQATADFIGALASRTRQRMMFQFAGGVELTVGEVAERCGLKPSTASEHLSLLRRGGLVVSRKEGREVFHRADGRAMSERLSALQAYLAVCCPPGAAC
ncbi:winged helix-turn-helix transcriptional regulator [Streptomyces sp. ISL-111]|nr:winged helix-turn-helix transcriptional regulator [Streptomyces sp. ISL-111]MBT2430501.1 winged helix-turn-helix transcriptional regulator [Streptomyces sp. ISL-112]MBT2466283.1 winged helix-turn-helix transcriptional regulator [Streptomyces sp. ISL-63]